MTTTDPARILYLEDSPRDAELVRDKLRQSGPACELHVVDDRAAYAAALAQTQFDLILSDYSLPGYDGMAALALARTKQPDVPFILISGTLGDEQAVDCVLRGATDFVLKQRLERLAPAVTRALAEAGERRQRRAAEAALKISGQKYRALFESSLDALMTLEPPDWLFTSGNPAAVLMFGAKSEEEFTAHAPWKLSPGRQPDGRASGEKALAMIETALREGGHTFEWTHQRLGGAEFPAEVLLTRMEYGGKVILQATVRDITVRKRAAEDISQQQERYQSILHTAIDGFWLTDSDGRLVDVNDTYCVMSGYSRAELLKMRIADLEVVESPDEVAAHIRKIMEQGEDRFASRHRRKDGSVYEVEVSVQYQRVEGGRWVAFLRDITARRQAEERERLARAVLEQLNRPGDTTDAISEILKLIKSSTGLEAVGIRLCEDDDYPYYLTNGFSREFVELENNLCALDAAGAPVRDAQGNIVLECMCGNILCGRFDPAKPFFTAGGSFWSNATSELLVSTTEQDRQARTRNRCNGEGYESVALIPLRADAEIIGLLQLNDHRRDRFTPEMINFFEGMVASIGVAFARKKMGEALEESEDKYRKLIELTRTGFVVLDRTGVVLEANSEYVRLTGRQTLAEILGRPVMEWTAGHDEEKNALAVAACLEDRHVNNLEIDYSDGQGRITPVEINAFAEGRGATLRIVALCRDITLRKRVATELDNNYQAQEVLKRILEHSLRAATLEEFFGEVLNGIFTLSWLNIELRGAILLVDEDGRSLVMRAQRGLTEAVRQSCAVVPFGCCLCGLAAQTGEVQFAACLDHRHVVNCAGMADHGLFCVPLLAGAKVLGVLNLYLRAGTGRDRAAEQFFLAIANTVAGVIVHRQSEEEIRRLNAVVEQAVEGVVITGPDGVIEYVNYAFERMTGYAAAEVKGAKTSILKSGRQDAAFYENLWATIRAGRAFTAVMVNRRKDGTCYPEEKVISPLTDVTGAITHFVGFARDVSAQQQLAEQLRQAQKMETVGQLAGGIAHDFNNILGIILNNAELGLDGLGPQSPGYDNLYEIRIAANRSAEIVRQLLAFSRKQVVQPEIIDLNALVADHLRMLRRLIGADITMAFNPEAELWRIRIDPAQAGQILTNLAANARDAIAGTGTINIATANVLMDESSGRDLAGMPAGEYVRITVSDTGSGIDPETLKSIFEPFFTTKPGKGTGLGLAMVYGIVRQNNGFVYAASEPGHATTFSLYLPRVTDEPVAVAAGENPAAVLPGTETVLVVDDEEKLVKVVRTILTRQGYTVLTATTVDTACRLAADHSGAIHLLLTDVIMPEMNGRDLQAKIMVLRPAIRTVFMSGHTNGVLTHRGVLDEDVTLLEKPFTSDALLRAVRAILDRERG